MVRSSHLSQSGYPGDTNHLHGKQVIIFEGCFGQVERGSQEGGFLPCQHVNASMLFLKKRRKACSYPVGGGGGGALSLHVNMPLTYVALSYGCCARENVSGETV